MITGYDPHPAASRQRSRYEDRSLVCLALLLLALTAPAVRQRHHVAAGHRRADLRHQPRTSRWMSEDLYVSPDEVQVVYEFRNNGDADQHALVAFPLPDITGDGDFMVSIPTEDPDNIFGFKTTFDGKPVEPTLHQYAFALGIDQHRLSSRSSAFRWRRSGKRPIDALNALTRRGSSSSWCIWAWSSRWNTTPGRAEKTDYTPVWTLNRPIAGRPIFPAGETVEVEHSYKPSVGGTVAVTFLARPTRATIRRRTTRRSTAPTTDFVKTVRKTLPDPDEPYGAPYTESWISYIWSTGANWAGRSASSTSPSTRAIRRIWCRSAGTARSRRPGRRPSRWRRRTSIRPGTANSKS